MNQHLYVYILIECYPLQYIIDLRGSTCLILPSYYR